MNVLQKFAASALLGLAALAGPPLAAQERIANPPGPWTHEASGTVVPRFLGAAERDSITRFDDGGGNVGIGFSVRTPEGALILTLYIYPPIEDFDCDQTYEDAKLAISESYGDIAPVSEEDAASPDGGRLGASLHARYYFPAGAMRSDYPAVYSDLYLHCAIDRGWLVKYRATWSGREEDFPDVGALLRQIGWGPGLG